MIDDLLFLYHWYCSINMKYLQNLLCRFGDADVSQLRHQIDCVAGRVATKALIVIFRERKGCVCPKNQACTCLSINVAHSYKIYLEDASKPFAMRFFLYAL